MMNALQLIVNGIFLLIPAMTNLVEHAGSSLMTLLILLGTILFFKSGRVSLSRQEKGVMGVFAGFFLICVVMHFGHILVKGEPLAWKLDHEMRLLAFIPIYYLFVQIKLKPWVLWIALLSGSILTGAYALNDAWAAYAAGRVVGPYNPCIFGYLSVGLSFMSISGYYFFYRKKKAFVLFPMAAFAGGLLAAFLSGTRGSIITIPFLTLLFLIQLKRHLKESNARIIMASMAGVFIILLLLYPHSSLSKRFDRGVREARFFFQNQDCADCFATDQAHHLRMWKESLRIIKAHPIVGVGTAGYRTIVNDRIARKVIAPGIEIFQSPHNMYLTTMTAYGIPGLLGLLALYMYPMAVFAGVIKKNRGNDVITDIAFCGLFLIAGYMLFSMTGTLFNRNMLIAFYIIMNAAILSICRPYLQPSEAIAE